MSLSSDFPYRVVSLTASLDRRSFRSGVPELDQYLHEQAGQDARRRVAAPFVLLDEADTVIGYYTLSAYGVHLKDLPEAISKKLPRYPMIPTTLLGRLAIHCDCRGRNLGRFLLMDALYRSWRNTAEVASVGVIAEAMSDAAREFYLRFGFVPILNSPNRLLLTMTRIGQAFASPGKRP